MPDPWHGYLGVEAEVFAAVGSPGHATDQAPFAEDHAVVDAEPLREQS